MKALLFVGLWVVSTAAFSTELRIYEQHLTIHPDCTLEIKRPDGSQEKKSFPLSRGYGECTILSLGGTNIPHLERMPMGVYIFLVESRKGLMEACESEHWGVMVARNGEVKIVPKTRPSGTCGADRDRKEFDYLYGHGTR